MRGKPLTVLFLAALLLRASFLWLEPPTQQVGDERTWTSWGVFGFAAAGLSPLRTPLIFYPPVYPYFIALPYLVFGSLLAVKWAQVAASALLVPAVARLGTRAWGPRVGLLAAAITAFYPELVWFSVHFWSETLFMVLLWWALERLLAADTSGGVGTAVAAGLLWGLAVLTRETVLYFTPLAALWLAANRSRPAARTRGAAFLLASALTVAPWAYRNWVVFRAFVPVSTAGGLNLFQGNARLSRQEVYDRYEAVNGRIEQYRYARSMGLEAIRERQPAWFFEKLVEQMPNFWEADSLVLIHIKRGTYGPVRPAVAVVSGLVVLLPYVALLMLFVPGLAAVRLDRPRALLVGLLAYYTLIHVVTHGFARYRLPVMPVVFLVSASAWVAWREGAPAPLNPARRALGWALAVGLAFCLVPSFERNFSYAASAFADQGGPAGQEAPRP